MSRVYQVGIGGSMDFYGLAVECAPWVAPQTLAAIVRTESGFKPLTIGVNGGSRLARQPVSKEEAVITARWLIEHGYNIDLGLGQINSANLARAGISLEEAFDPCRNLAASAGILRDNYQAASVRHRDPQSALHAALSAYNTGTFFRGFKNGYVQKVVSNAGGGAVPIAVINPKKEISADSGRSEHVTRKKIAKKSRGGKPPLEQVTEVNGGDAIFDRRAEADIMIFR